ncbi:MAG: ferredoxin family protein [Oligoflexia bacterium]|nr:ferredoxin family protein [Oligoflexia bacterium]
MSEALFKESYNNREYDRAYRKFDTKKCKTCESKICTLNCPQKCITWDEKNLRLDFIYECCVECGTCAILCNKNAIEWEYPTNGKGVAYFLS